MGKRQSRKSGRKKQLKWFKAANPGTEGKGYVKSVVGGKLQLKVNNVETDV